MTERAEQTHLDEEDYAKWFQLCGRLAVTAFSYPFEYVKVLIQIGHEPLPPYPTHTLLGRPALGLPGVFAYLRHIRSVDGFFGMYRGLGSKLCCNFVSMSTFLTVSDKLPNFTDENLLRKPERELSDEQKLLVQGHELVKTSIARCVTVIVSHPFHIITIRTIAQFVGRETKYCGIIGSVIEISRQDGILGFFHGLIPRLIGELLVLWTSTTASMLINTYLVEEDTLKGYVKSSMQYLASAVFYPFNVVSHVSIVNNCGLKAGLPSNMPIYSSWSDCWSHLSAIGQLKRGSSILWRYSSGPFMTSPAYGGSTSRRVYAMTQTIMQ